jgi:hypothetical protein
MSGDNTAEAKRQRIAEANAMGRCPNCGQPLDTGKPVGSGRRSEGIFCSLDCLATFHEDYFRERARASKPAQN